MGRFRLLTHNILADVWCIPAYYPNLPDPGRHLASNRRRTATYHHIRAAEPDLICLQEVQVGRRPPPSPCAIEAHRLPQVTELQHLYDAFHDEFHLSDLAANCPTTAPYAHGTLAMIRKRSLFGNRVRIGAHVWSDEGSAGQILELTTTSGRSLTVANLHLSWKRYGSEARLQAIEVERRLDEAGADPSTTISA